MNCNYLICGSQKGHSPQVENDCSMANTASNFAAVSRDSKTAALLQATWDLHKQQNQDISNPAVKTSQAPLKETTPKASVPAVWWALE